MPVITISGHHGSGFREIAHEVADYLELTLVDESLLFKGVAERLHVSLEKLEELIRVPFKIFDRILYEFIRAAAKAPGIGGADAAGMYAYLYDPPVDDWSFRKTLEETVRDLAATGRLVLLGPGIHLILRAHPGTLHVFTTAPLEARVKRVMERRNISEVEAWHQVEVADKRDKAFVRKHLKANAEDLRFYDLVINTDKTSVKAAVPIILRLADSVA